MRKKLYLGEGKGEEALQKAWLEVHDSILDEQESAFYLSQPLGEIYHLGENQNHQRIYWLATSQSKQICKQGLADLWALLGDTIANWEIVEVSREEDENKNK